MTTGTVEKSFELEVTTPDGQTYICNVEATSKCYYRPGRTFGPPEDCYPDETEQETSVRIIDCTPLDSAEAIPLTTELLRGLSAGLPMDWIEAQLWEKFLNV